MDISLRVLLVDDEDLEVRGLVNMIKAFDLPLEICGTARNGHEGILRTHELHPAIILTDLRMPQMSGIEMIRQLKEEGSDAQFVIVSGYEDFEAARAGLELGTIAYLLKPVNRMELLRILSRCCAALLLERQSQNHGLYKDAPQYSAGEENTVRQLLFSSEEKLQQLLRSAYEKRIVQQKALAVAIVKVACPQSSDMYDYMGLLQHFAKRANIPAPIVVDYQQAALIFAAPEFVEDNAFLDMLAKSADDLLSLFCSMGEIDVYIYISDISRTPTQLPMLHRQCQKMLEKRLLHHFSHVQFYVQADEGNARHARERDHQVVTRIQHIIETEYASPLTVDSIAEKLYLSPTHIRRLFKSLTGLTMMDYVECVRMDRAKRLLSIPHHKIQEVGAMVGYENPSYFNLVFKKYFAMTPGEYRKSSEGNA